MISHGYWQRRFGLAPSVVGKTINLGVVRDIRSHLRDQQLNRPRSAVYLPFPQAPPTMLGQVVFELRTLGNPVDIIAAARRGAQSVEKDLDWVSTMEIWLHARSVRSQGSSPIVEGVPQDHGTSW